ncbi:hypothetical protein Tco_0562011 [Tanacetum coccineum]
MSGIVPPIPPPFGASSGNPGSPNVNRVDTMPTTTDPINTTTTTNVAQTVVDENLPQLLDSRGRSHIINVPTFDKEDFTSWKVRFLVFLDGLEPYLLKTLKDGPFVPISSLSTTENPFPKRQNQWSNAESRLANQDKQLKSIIISCLLNDVMKSVIKCKTAKEMWNDLILAHEGPSDTRNTNIPALRLNDSDVEEDQRTNNEFMADLNGKKKGKSDKGKSENGLIAESFDWDEEFVSLEDEGTTMIRAFMAIVEDEPPDARSGQWVDITMKKVHRLLSMTDSNDRKQVLDYTYVGLIYVEDQRKNIVNKYNLLKQELSLHKSKLSNLKNTVSINCSLQNKVIRVNLENESLKDEISNLKRAIEKWTCSKVTLDQLLSKQIPGNIVKALRGKGRRKENNPSKEVLFTKADVSTSESALMITSDSEDDSDIQEPLPPLPKLTWADPTGASKSLISLSDHTTNMADLTLNTASKDIKKSSNKVSQTYVIKKMIESKHPAV